MAADRLPEVHLYQGNRCNRACPFCTVEGSPHGWFSEHTPEVCFSTRAFKQLGSRQRAILARHQGSEMSLDDQFWFVDFQKNRVTSQRVRVYWAWSTDQRWRAPDGPKTAFAGSPHLYKIQLATTTSAVLGFSARGPLDDACGRFLQQFIPATRDYLATDQNRNNP